MIFPIYHIGRTWCIINIPDWCWLRVYSKNFLPLLMVTGKVKMVYCKLTVITKLPNNVQSHLTGHRRCPRFFRPFTLKYWHGQIWVVSRERDVCPSLTTSHSRILGREGGREGECFTKMTRPEVRNQTETNTFTESVGSLLGPCQYQQGNGWVNSL